VVRDGARPGQAAGRPLLSPAGRRRAAALAVAGLIVTAGLGAAFAGQGLPDAFDRWADALLVARLGQIPGLVSVTDLGTLAVAGPVCVAAVAACAAFRRYRAALLVIIAVPVSVGLTEVVLKPLVGRLNNGALTYPSGHTATVTAMAVAAVVVLTGPARPALPGPARRLLAGLVLAAVPVVAVALAAIQYHYLTDTVGGAGQAAAVVLSTALAQDAACAGLARRAAGDAEAAPPRGIPEPARELPRA
jgi:membrane-associated phospholipid phosphatase